MHISSHYKRLRIRRLKIAVIAVAISLFFIPNFTKFEKTGENFFKVKVNGIDVGSVSSIEDANKFLLKARRNVNRSSDKLTFAETELTYEGEEVLYGKIDKDYTVVNNMEQVIRKFVSENLIRAYEVKINGYIVTLHTKDEVVRLLQAAIDKYDEERQFTVSLSSDELRELPVLVPKISSKEEAREEDEARENAVFSGGFDSDMTEFFKSIEPAGELDFEDYDLGMISMSYGDKIEVVEVYVNPSELTDIELAIAEVTQEELNNEIYKVVSGDTLSGISLKVNIPLEDLIAMNDSLEDQNSLIRPDDELIITVPKPKLSVIRQEEMYYEEDYTAPVEYILNDSWYTSDRVVHQQPSDGHRKVVAMVTFKNDDRVETEILKEEVTYQSIPMIVEKGTKIPPSYIKPISGGRVTSPFGRRSRPTRGASTFHKGVDWGTPIGTPVYASCGGTVAKAGWGKGYGNVVYINHPDGRQTRYGHLSKVLVSPGQKVSQGQRIALSGNTGVSTGPHLHFEILINGSQVNPLNYLGVK